MAETERCPECEEMQKTHKDYCIWCSAYKSEDHIAEAGKKEPYCGDAQKEE